MHALTIAKGWGPSASRVSTTALGSPRRPAAALAPRGDVREKAGARLAVATGPGPRQLAGRSQARPEARGYRKRVLAHPVRVGAARKLPTALSHGSRRLRTAGVGGAGEGGAPRRGLGSPSRTSPGLTCLSRETSTVLTPVMSKFRRFSSDLRSMTRRSVIFLPSA